METGKTGSSGFGSRSGKYFKYAIGEIILVVIGILIALSINNWNEERKAADYTKLLFKKTLEELKFNIEKANASVANYRNQNFKYYKVINKKANEDDYRNRGYAYLLMSGEKVKLSEETFLKLLNSEEKLSQVQDSLLSKLKYFYSKTKGEVDFLDTKLYEFIFNLHKKNSDEKSWYPDFINFNIISDDMIDYFLSDPEYIKNATYYKTSFLSEQLSSIKDFRNEAIIRYDEISNYLNFTPDTAIVKDLTNYKHYLGTYKSDNLTLYVKEEANSLIQTVVADNNTTTIQNGTLYLDSKSYFTDRRNFGRLIYDNDKKVIKIEYTRGGQKYIFEKIK